MGSVMMQPRAMQAPERETLERKSTVVTLLRRGSRRDARAKVDNGDVASLRHLVLGGSLSALIPALPFGSVHRLRL